MEIVKSCPYCESSIKIHSNEKDYIRCLSCEALIRMNLIAYNYENNYQKALKQAEQLKIDNFKRIVKHINLELNHKVVYDLGCGTGAVIRHLRGEGHMEAYGFDPYSDIEEFRTLSEPKKYIDILFLFDVVEHFSDLAFIENFVNKNLTSGSKILITTPNSKSKWIDYLGQYWPHFNEEHLSIGSFASLDKWAKKINARIQVCGSLSKLQSLVHFFNTHFKKSISIKYDFKFTMNTGEIYCLLVVL